MKAVPKASYTDERGFGTVRQKCRDTSPSPTIRDAPWEHDQGEKPQGSGAQSVPCYVRIVGMGEKLRPKAILQNGHVGESSTGMWLNCRTRTHRRGLAHASSMDRCTDAQGPCSFATSRR